ncbi:MAG: hypothetical protein IPI19_16020 [Ignavibacteriales bacterium]|nr:hypothetical protein [Ignavibacteriales bacterium]
MDKYQIVIAGMESRHLFVLYLQDTHIVTGIAIIKTDKQNSIVEEILTSISNFLAQKLNIFSMISQAEILNVLQLTGGKQN